MGYVIVEPSVAGELGRKTKLDRSVHPPVVSDLQFAIDFWQGDALITSFPVFLIEDRALTALKHAGVSGFETGIVDLVLSDVGAQLVEMGQSLSALDDAVTTVDALPTFHWFKSVGVPDLHDVFLDTDFRLVLSERAYTILKRFGLANAIVESYTAPSA